MINTLSITIHHNLSKPVNPIIDAQVTLLSQEALPGLVSEPGSLIAQGQPGIRSGVAGIRTLVQRNFSITNQTSFNPQ